MTGTTRFWLKWFGITVGTTLLIVVLAFVAGAQFLKGMVQDFEEADVVLEEVASELGAIEDFRLGSPGAIDAERVETFVALRDSVARSRRDVEESLSLLSSADSVGRLRRARATVGLPKRISTHLLERNSALLDAGLGLGEYYYLYAVAFYSWLGHSPGDGPSFQVVGDNGYLFETLEPMEETEVRRQRDEGTRRSLNDRLLPVLRRQLSDLEEPDREGVAGAWHEALLAEIAAMEADPHRLPWQEGLPAALERSLEPYRDRLEASYSELGNPVDVAAARRT